MGADGDLLAGRGSVEAPSFLRLCQSDRAGGTWRNGNRKRRPGDGGRNVVFRRLRVTRVLGVTAGARWAPVVLVIQEIFGVHEHIKDVCGRLAHEGYFALAPELYARQGNVADIPDMQEIIDKVVRKVPDQQVLDDLDATAAYAEASGRGDLGRLGVVGFCWVAGWPGSTRRTSEGLGQAPLGTESCWPALTAPPLCSPASR